MNTVAGSYPATVLREWVSELGVTRIISIPALELLVFDTPVYQATIHTQDPHAAFAQVGIAEYAERAGVPRPVLNAAATLKALGERWTPVHEGAYVAIKARLQAARNKSEQLATVPYICGQLDAPYPEVLRCFVYDYPSTFYAWWDEFVKERRVRSD